MADMQVINTQAQQRFDEFIELSGQSDGVSRDVKLAFLTRVKSEDGPEVCVEVVRKLSLLQAFKVTVNEMDP